MGAGLVTDFVPISEGTDGNVAYVLFSTPPFISKTHLGARGL